MRRAATSTTVRRPAGDEYGRCARRAACAVRPCARLPSACSADKTYFAVVDFHDVDRRDALSAFLTAGSRLGERDLAVQAGDLGFPQRPPNRFRIGLAGLCDCRGKRLDAIVAAEAFGQARERKAALAPLGDERFR